MRTYAGFFVLPAKRTVAAFIFLIALASAIGYTLGTIEAIRDTPYCFELIADDPKQDTQRL